MKEITLTVSLMGDFESAASASSAIPASKAFLLYVSTRRFERHQTG